MRGEVTGGLDAVRRAWAFLWDPAEPNIKWRIGAAFALMIGAKIVLIQVPFLFKMAIDTLSDPASPPPSPAVLAALTPATLLLLYGGTRAAADGMQQLRNALFARVAEGALRRMQRRFFTLIWSDFNLAEREIRYYDGLDSSTRKMKGTINLASFTDVRAESIDGATGFTITTPGRVWELVPDTAAEVNEWVALLSKLLHHTRGFSVIASMSNLALIDAASGADGGDERRKQGELTVILKRKLGISISMLGQDSAVEQMEPDGAAAASGVISPGDALLAANGVELHGCKQAIKLLTKSAGVVKLRAATRVVRGGYMHKLGEGLGGWRGRLLLLLSISVLLLLGRKLGWCLCCC